MSKLDEKWFEKYLAIGSFSEIDFLTKNNSKDQKELFLAGDIINPTFGYQIDYNDLQNRKDELLALKGQIIAEEGNELVKNIYVEAIQYKLTILELVIAVTEKDNVEVNRLSIELYGGPKTILMSKGLGMIKYLLDKYKVVLSQDFMTLVEGVSVVDTEWFEPIDQSRPLKALEVKDLFEQKLKEFELDWTVEPSDSISSLNVGSIFTKKIFIPTDKKWTTKAVEGLLDHEVGVHIRRAENGLKSPLLLLSNGLAGYLVGEEGLAMYMELEKYKSKLPGVGNYLAVALASGLDSQPRTFREVFDLMKEYQSLIQTLNKSDFNENDLNNKAWEFTWRAFRGTTGNHNTSECLTRDTVYFSGYNEIKNLFETNSPEIDRLFIGKYDPANLDHRKILDSLS